MPIYEYQCTNCSHKMEALQKISDKPLTDCPACNEEDLKKLVSAASFRLKGGGWYETDFKTGEKRQLADSDSGNDPSTAKSSDSASSDAKPAGDKQASAKTSANTSSTESDAKGKNSTAKPGSNSK